MSSAAIAAPPACVVGDGRAEADVAPPPPPLAGRAGRSQAARGQRVQEVWHGHALSHICKKLGDGTEIKLGWGIICGRHGPDLCKKAMNLGSGARALTDEECVITWKRWVIAGMAIGTSEPSGRFSHVSLTNARELLGGNPETLEREYAEVVRTAAA